MPLPWQRFSQLWNTLYLALLHIIMDPCTEFQINWSKNEGVVWSTRFLHQFYFKMLLPWQRNSRLWRKWYLALIHINMDLCCKFQINWSITEGVVWSTKILHKFHSKNAVAMATQFSTLTNNISCTSIHHYGPMYQISGQLIKNWGRS